MNGDLAALAWRFALLSLVAVGGGNAMYPQVHADVVTQTHWLTERDFTELVAISQAAPGPNVLIVPLAGWHVAGWAGAFVALAAFLIPCSVLTLVAGRALRRRADAPLVVAMRGALLPIAAALFLASGIALARSAGLHAMPVAIAVVVAVLATVLDLNPLVWLACAAVAGAVFG